MVARLLVLTGELVEHNLRAPVPDLPAGDVSVDDIGDGMVGAAAADVVDDHLAIVAELRGDTVRKLFERLEPFCLHRPSSLLRFLSHHTTLCREINDFPKIFFSPQKILFDLGTETISDAVRGALFPLNNVTWR